MQGPAIEPGQGLLAQAVSPWNDFRSALVVSGVDEEGVRTAAQSLTRTTKPANVRGTQALIAQPTPLSEDATSQRSLSLTLASLGYADQIAYGARSHSYTFNLALPLGWQQDSSPLFVLRFSHAFVLDPTVSTISVRLNGETLGSAELTDHNAEQGEMAVSLPIRLLGSGRDRLQVEVEMSFPLPERDTCRDAEDERAWTRISGESEFLLLNRSVNQSPGLYLFPYPLSRDASLERTLVVLPAEADGKDLQHLVDLAARLGSPSASEYFPVNVAYASDVTLEQWNDAHLILVGQPGENLIFKELGSYLPYPVGVEEGAEPLIIDGAVFELDPTRTLGLLEVTSSPLDSERALLAISGTNREGIDLAIKALLQQTDELSGNLAVIEANQGSSSDQSGVLRVSTWDVRLPDGGAQENGGGARSVKSDEVLLAERWWK
jgi:hypothetical protein